MKVTIIPIVIGSFSTVTKSLLKEDVEVGGRSGELPKYSRERPEYWAESWRQEESCCQSNSSENHQLKLMRKTHMSKYNYDII